MASQLRRDEYLVLWVCATLDELDVAVEILDEIHNTPDPEALDYSIICGRFGEHNVVIAYLHKEGSCPTTTLVEKLKRAFTSLRFGLMVGIGGGVPNKEADIRLGDVVVGSPSKTHKGVMQYKSSKSGGFEPTGSLQDPPQVLLNAIANVRIEHKRGRRKLEEYLSELGGRVTATRDTLGPDTLYAATYDHTGGPACEECDTSYIVDREPRSEGFGVVVHYGTIASGDSIMKNATERDELSLRLGGVLCVETEITELIRSFPCLVVRGICDYADSHKNGRWRLYAAWTAAAYAKELLSMLPQVEVAQMITVDEAMREVSHFRSIGQREKSPIRGIWEKRGSREEYRNIKEFINEIAANHHVSFDSIIWEWELPPIPASDIKSDIVLMLCTSYSPLFGTNYAHVRASTYWEYLKHSKWADFIMDILDILTRVEMGVEEHGFSMYASVNPPVWITCTSLNLSINFSNKKTCLEVLGLVEVLDWLCKSMCRSINKNDQVVSSASYAMSHLVATQSSVYGLPGSSVQPFVELKRYSLSRRGRNKHSCWLSFFDSCVIVDSVFPPRDGFGKGLETSFDLMIALGGSEFCLKINGSLVFLGYRTVLYPVAIDGNCAQFHLITTTRGQINPYTLALENIISVEDSSQFKTMRCFIGWCEEAHINLGTRHLSADIKYTGGRDHPKSLESDGFALLSQFGASAPLSAIAGVQKNFKYSRHRIRFSPTENYLALLQDCSQQQVALYDSKQRRCWLVPKLSLLLHMSQRYNSCSAVGLIPYAEPHMDARDLIPILEPAGQINVLGGQANSLQLQQLLFALNIRILDTAEAVRESGRGKLYGFEFQDILRSPDRGSCMKELKIPSKRKAWLELVNAVGTVIVCSGLGEVISVEENSTRKCEKCNRVPENEDYFTATIPCLSRLAEQKGVELRIGSDGIKFSDKAFWKLEMNPFIQCTHAENSKKTCWERPGLIQQVVHRGLLDWTASLRTPKPQPVQSQPVQSSLVKGAVVFG